LEEIIKVSRCKMASSSHIFNKFNILWFKYLEYTLNYYDIPMSDKFTTILEKYCWSVDDKC
jgi:hypothetical protein